ncbi:PIN domain-containing protein [Aliihoeflea aestuarii]|jgi:predicted nucleic-acid-binding protein|uniref:PIN domain-containing protein n=1 Tax=Aliihoeflea aestuarii TaxID=453840 RepID=UPI0025B4CF3D|nr:type II toxin-antitoxin system VapC family toxin [Aliihoeflea aestuarii]
MSRVGLDANILLRALLNDDAVHSAVARKLLGKLNSGNRGYVGISAILETFWVLRSRYKVPREILHDTLRELLTIENLDVESAEPVAQALAMYVKGNMDFPDALLAERNLEAGCSHTLTFDQRAARLIPSMELLS